MQYPEPEICEQCSRVVLLEQQARRAHGQLKTIIEYATCGIMLLDSEARILYANRYVSKATGYNADELINRSWFDFTHPDETRLRRMLLERTLEQPGQLRNRGYLRFKSKPGVWVLLGIRVLNLIDEPDIGVIIAYVSDESAQMSRYVGNGGGNG